uniref:Uncharacterized protein n=1 Tax=Octopus bimaculoides TaxID=37653 RepID=A0A0L8HJC0_OCTBM
MLCMVKLSACAGEPSTLPSVRCPSLVSSHLFRVLLALLLVLLVGLSVHSFISNLPALSHSLSHIITHKHTYTTAVSLYLFLSPSLSFTYRHTRNLHIYTHGHCDKRLVPFSYQTDP